MIKTWPISTSMASYTLVFEKHAIFKIHVWLKKKRRKVMQLPGDFAGVF